MVIEVKLIGDNDWGYYVVVVDGVVNSRHDTYEEAKHAQYALSL